MARVIREVRPRFAFVENSPVLTSRGLGRVLGDLAEMGFDARWGVFSAADAGAPSPSESESGLWPTPKASAAGPDFAAIDRGKTGQLADMVAMYPTPRSTDGDRGGRGDLIQAVRGNPNAHYSKDGRSNGPSGNELGRAVNRRTWPTPNASDNRDRGNLNSPCVQRRIEKGKQIGLSMAAGGSLNPTWVEWLMGWIIGWTDLSPLAMDKYQQWLRSHGAC
jgi:hypothetical protein